MLVGRVVGHEIDDDPDAARVRLREHLVEVGKGAEDRVDVAVVGDVVASILLGRALEGAQPDGVDAEGGEVSEVARHPAQVADAIARLVSEGAGVDLVDDGGAPPFAAGSFLAGERRGGDGFCRSHGAHHTAPM